MDKNEFQAEYDHHMAALDRIIAELDKQLAGWTPKKKEEQP